jgi:hypothetical protein
MNQYYTIQITGGTPIGTYSIFYNTIGVGNYALLYPTLNIASGITLSELITGTTIQVPEPTNKIYLFNENCSTFQEFIVSPPDEQYPCLCLTITELSPLSTTSLDFCYSGVTTNSKPEYTNSSGYTIYWNTLGYWELSGYTINGGSTVLRSTYSSNIPDSAWNAYGLNAFNYSINVIQGECTSQITPILLKLDLNVPTCEGISDGSVIALATGGSGGFTYSLDGILYLNNTGIFTGLSGGTYTIYAKDSIGSIYNQSFTINSPTINYISIGANSTTQIKLYTLGNMSYYLVNIIYDTSTIPSGTTVVVNLQEVINLTYSEPGQVLFDTSLIKVFKNSSQLSLTTSGSTALSIASPLPCNPLLFNKYVGNSIYNYNNISLQKGDSLIVEAIYGIDVDTNGGVSGSCITQAQVNVESNLTIVSYDCTCCEINNISITENGIPIIYS